MSLTVIEVLSNGYIEVLLCANSRFAFYSCYNNSALHEDEFVRRAIYIVVIL